MGTRSLTLLCEEGTPAKPGREIVVMYRQMDGYPSGHGQELADFLGEFTIVNGMSGGQPKVIANGADCLAAQVIAKFKVQAGNVYLNPAGTRGVWEEYLYTVWPAGDIEGDKGRVYMRVEGDEGRRLWQGPAVEFTPQKCEVEAT